MSAKNEMADDDPGARERQDLLRRFGLPTPEMRESQPLPVVTGCGSVVILIGDGNTVHLTEPARDDRKRGKPGP